VTALSLVQPKAPKPPKHLSKEVGQWWSQVADTYELEAHHLRLLQCAAEAWDRMQQAREAVAAQGLTFTDSRGSIKANPAVAIERDSRTAFVRLVRELDLDEAMGKLDARPPALRSNR
jgi:P27 family predicted phage terminase small subunit